MGPRLDDGDGVAFVKDSLENIDATSLAIERSAPDFVTTPVESDSPDPIPRQNSPNRRGYCCGPILRQN
jgi:hypothetical protein